MLCEKLKGFVWSRNTNKKLNITEESFILVYLLYYIRQTFDIIVYITVYCFISRYGLFPTNDGPTLRYIIIGVMFNRIEY